jgi:BCCT family betaine/carnitine transporter
VFWAFLLGLLPITLVYLGGLKPLQSAVTLVSVPLFAVIVLLTLSLFKSLREDTATSQSTATETG